MNDLKAYLRSLAERDYDVDYLGGGHIKIYWNGRRVATSSATPGDRRALLNLRGHVKRFERSLQQETR